MTQRTIRCCIGYQRRCAFFATLPNRLSSVGKISIFFSIFCINVMHDLRVILHLTTTIHNAREIRYRHSNFRKKFVFFQHRQMFETINEMNLFGLDAKSSKHFIQLGVDGFQNNIPQNILVIWGIGDEKLTEFIWNRIDVRDNKFKIQP